MIVGEFFLTSIIEVDCFSLLVCELLTSLKVSELFLSVEQMKEMTSAGHLSSLPVTAGGITSSQTPLPSLSGEDLAVTRRSLSQVLEHTAKNWCFKN